MKRLLVLALVFLMLQPSYYSTLYGYDNVLVEGQRTAITQFVNVQNGIVELQGDTFVNKLPKKYLSVETACQFKQSTTYSVWVDGRYVKGGTGTSFKSHVKATGDFKIEIQQTRGVVNASRVRCQVKVR
jgi:hypothetical protein